MAINRTARIARTANDQGHLNRLCVPEFGVVEIQIKGQGGNKSKSYRDGSSATPKAPSGTGADSFHFAPGPQYNAATWAADASLKDDVQIVYTLHNPQWAITAAKLELFTRFSATAVWTRDLTGDEMLHGEHTLQFNAQDNWDGKIDAHADFPDQFLTVEHSPYKLKLTVSGVGVNLAPAVWTYFHVMIGKLELEYGPKSVLPVQPVNIEGGIHSETYDDLIAQGAEPPKSGTVKIFLKTDTFTVGGNDMFDNTLYTRLETLWGDGPQIPLFCKVWVKSSDDKDVIGHKALGKLKFLWDWESVSEASKTSFTKKAEKYLVKKTKPKGRNCHLDRGGKRASDKQVFPAQAGTAPGALAAGSFPFQVEAVPDPRKWAAYSYAWNDGVAASKTGVIFQPSRMAGDVYKLTVYVDQVYDRAKKYKLNVDTDAPLPSPEVLKAVTGNYQVWRRVNVRKYVKKNGSVTETINMGKVAGEYAKAFLELKDLTGGAISNVAQADWNSREAAAIGALNTDSQRMITPGDQYGFGGGGVYMRTRRQYAVAYLDEGGAELDAVGLDPAKLTPALRTALLDAVKDNPFDNGAAAAAVDSALATEGAGLDPAESTSLRDAIGNHYATVDTFMSDPANEMEDASKYRETAEDTAMGIVGKAFDPDADAGSGCTIFHCDKLNDIRAKLLGWAFDVTAGNGNRCGFLLCATQAAHDKGDSMENTATHEYGHHFFLPHTIDAGEEKNYNAHDKSVKTCIMSYNVPTEFCGFCQLRLRGWSKDALTTSAGKNSKS